jgi:hypothetical protein
MELYSTLKESCDAKKIDWLGIQNKYNSMECSVHKEVIN